MRSNELVIAEIVSTFYKLVALVYIESLILYAIAALLPYALQVLIVIPAVAIIAKNIWLANKLFSRYER